MSVSRDKKAYSSRESAIIRGSVWDAGSGLDAEQGIVTIGERT